MHPLYLAPNSTFQLPCKVGDGAELQEGVGSQIDLPGESACKLGEEDQRMVMILV